MRHAALTAALLLPLAGSALHAADRPIGGDRLSLKDPAGKPTGRSVKFKAAKDPAIDPASGADPTGVGATLEVVGNNPGDGSSGAIFLPPALWTGLGNPAGSRGYKYKDKLIGDGIKTVTLKAGSSGGTLAVSGGKSDWAYAITQPQGTIDLRLTVGGDVYCARFTTFTQNVPGKVKAKLAPPPPDCTPAPGPVCGNGVAEGTEECDEGGTT